MYMKRWIGILLLLCALLSFAACANTSQPIEDAEEEIKEPLNLSTLLTREQVEEATGIAVGEAEAVTDGSAAYFSADGAQAVYISSMEMSAEKFDEMRETLSASAAVIDAPNLAEKAFWYEEQYVLTVYENGRALEIRVEYAPANANTALLASRQLAVLLLEKM